MLELGQEIDDRRHAQERRKKITSMIAKPSQLSCCVPTLSRLISFRADFIATCLVSCQLHPLSRFVPTSSVVSFRANFIRCLVSCQLHPLSRSVPTSSLVSFRANFKFMELCVVSCRLQVHGTLSRFVPNSSSLKIVLICVDVDCGYCHVLCRKLPEVSNNGSCSPGTVALQRHEPIL
jgi:hypothetical protein